MQAIRFWSVVALFLAVGAVPGQAPDNKSVVYDTPLYPLRVGNQWRYKATVGGTPSQKVLVIVEKQEVFIYKNVHDKKEVIEPISRFRLKIVSGTKELTEHVAVLKDGVYRFTTAGMEISPPIRFLKLPPTNGESWSVDSAAQNVVLKGTFTCDDDSVKVPAGQFQVKRVSTQGFQVGFEKMSQDYWFAPDVGIVQQRVRVANSDVLFELEEFKIIGSSINSAQLQRIP